MNDVTLIVVVLGLIGLVLLAEGLGLLGGRPVPPPARSDWERYRPGAAARAAREEPERWQQ